jgi:hypothetical protein
MKIQFVNVAFITASLLSILVSFSYSETNALLAISRDLVGQASCGISQTVTPAQLNFIAVGEAGDKGLDGSYYLSGNSSIASSGALTNISYFNVTSNAFSLIYQGKSEECPPTDIPFNSTIVGSCGQDVPIEFSSDIITGKFSGNVSCRTND